MNRDYEQEYKAFIDKITEKMPEGKKDFFKEDLSNVKCFNHKDLFMLSFAYNDLKEENDRLKEAIKRFSNTDGDIIEVLNAENSTLRDNLRESIRLINNYLNASGSSGGFTASYELRDFLNNVKL
jgi:hypothetical protein